MAKVSKELVGFSGREISKLAIAWQVRYMSVFNYVCVLGSSYDNI